MTRRVTVAVLLVACAGQKPTTETEKEKWVQPRFTGTGESTPGFGRVRRDEKPKTEVWIGTPSATGGLDAVTIRRSLRQRTGHIRYCHMKEQLARPELGFGEVALTFQIDGSGNVIVASGTGFDQAVTDCVVGAVRGIAFPRPADGATVEVTAVRVKFAAPP